MTNYAGAKNRAKPSKLGRAIGDLERAIAGRNPADRHAAIDQVLRGESPSHVEQIARDIRRALGRLDDAGDLETAKAFLRRRLRDSEPRGDVPRDAGEEIAPEDVRS